MIAFAHTKGLEVLLETHTEKNSNQLLKQTLTLLESTNRNLATLKIDLKHNKRNS